MANKIKNILESKIFLFACALVTTVCWVLELPLISITFLVVSVILTMFICDDLKPVIVPLFILPYVFTTHDENYYAILMPYLIILLSACVVALLYFLYKKVFKQKYQPKKGY